MGAITLCKTPLVRNHSCCSLACLSLSLPEPQTRKHQESRRLSRSFSFLKKHARRREPTETMKSAVLALLLAACVTQAAAEVYFQEKFDGEGARAAWGKRAGERGEREGAQPLLPPSRVVGGETSLALRAPHRRPARARAPAKRVRSASSRRPCRAVERRAGVRSNDFCPPLAARKRRGVPAGTPARPPPPRPRALSPSHTLKTHHPKRPKNDEQQTAGRSAGSSPPGRPRARRPASGSTLPASFSAATRRRPRACRRRRTASSTPSAPR